jgi:hypothetical protein
MMSFGSPSGVEEEEKFRSLTQGLQYPQTSEEEIANMKIKI